MDHALGRLVDHDPLSRNFAHFAAAKPLVKRTTRWTTKAPVLDQGNTGSCTGNAMAQWLNTDYATRVRTTPAHYLTEHDALSIYSLGTRLDGIPGNTFPPNDDGGSGLGVAKAAKSLGYLSGYTWTFSLAGFLAALQTQPVIVGTAFYEDMEDPNAQGVVRPTGELAGGHEYLVVGVNYQTDLLEFVNSWSDQWGVRGHFFMPIEDFAKLLVDKNMPGDVTAPTMRH